MDLTIRIKISNNVKYGYAICLKFGRIFVAFLNMLGPQGNTSICTTIKKNLLLYFRKFSAFIVIVII